VSPDPGLAGTQPGVLHRRQQTTWRRLRLTTALLNWHWRLACHLLYGDASPLGIKNWRALQFERSHCLLSPGQPSGQDTYLRGTELYIGTAIVR